MIDEKLDITKDDLQDIQNQLSQYPKGPSETLLEQIVINEPLDESLLFQKPISKPKVKENLTKKEQNNSNNSSNLPVIRDEEP